MVWYRLAADAILIVHAAFIAFVLLGLVVVWVGYFRGWEWTRRWSFRIAHLLAIAFVVVQAFLGMICPLTEWENTLRVRGGQTPYAVEGFIAHWLHKLIFFQAEPWVFTACYSAFALLVLGTLVFAPPRRKRRLEPADASTAGVADGLARS